MSERNVSSTELVAAMLEPGFYPDRPSEVELRETHSSWVFLAGEHAYKVKKPVRFPFLDYSTLERRREMCREELRLNRRFAPGYYLGVDAVVAGPRGPRLAPEDDPGAIEYVVRMRRVPAERTLAALASVGPLAEAAARAGARLAELHASAEVAGRGSVDAGALAAPIEENVETLQEVGPPILGHERLRAMDGFTAAFLAARGEQLAERIATGHVRECHGDLRAEHVIVEDGVAAYDCVEFNPSLRTIDVAADIAFLVMDLWRLGDPRAAHGLVRAYREAGGDVGDDALLHFYAAYRAWVRSKVACLRHAELDAADPVRDAAAAEARDLMALGHRLAWRARLPLVLAVCGVAASGKTALASGLAAISGLEHARSDVVRKRLAGLAAGERAAAELYTEAFDRRTYAELGRGAARAVREHGGAIVDATFRRADQREAFREALEGELVAHGEAPPVVFAELRAPEAVVLERAASRQAGGEDASDAGPEVVRHQLATFEPLYEVPASERTTIDAEAPLEEQLIEVEALCNRPLARRPGPR